MLIINNSRAFRILTVNAFLAISETTMDLISWLLGHTVMRRRVPRESQLSKTRWCSCEVKQRSFNVDVTQSKTNTLVDSIRLWVWSLDTNPIRFIDGRMQSRGTRKLAVTSPFVASDRTRPRSFEGGNLTCCNISYIQREGRRARIETPVWGLMSQVAEASKWLSWGKDS
jgi:hypothetical protein